MLEGYNIFHAIWDAITFRLRLVSKSKATERYNICQDCELRNKTLNVCTICGCVIPLKVKLVKSSCPMEKW